MNAKLAPKCSKTKATFESTRKYTRVRKNLLATFVTKHFCKRTKKVFLFLLAKQNMGARLDTASRCDGMGEPEHWLEHFRKFVWRT